MTVRELLMMLRVADPDSEVVIAVDQRDYVPAHQAYFARHNNEPTRFVIAADE